MSINREELLKIHNPTFTAFDYDSPLTIGNGEFAFTADCTGLQTFFDEYLITTPLCTMSQWGWHTTPVSSEKYSYEREELVKEMFDTYGRQVPYDTHNNADNKDVINWFRENPHKCNLAKIGFIFTDDSGKQACIDDINSINQTLELYNGIIHSNFKVYNEMCNVKTCVHPKLDLLCADISSSLIKNSKLKVKIDFPYGCKITAASDWGNKNHSSKIIYNQDNTICIKRTMDKDIYYCNINSNATIKQTDKNSFELIPDENDNNFKLAIGFYKDEQDIKNISNINSTFEFCREHWNSFWNNGGIVRLNRSKDLRALELERRIVLSQYLTAVQTSGSMPPAETGLTCNSWYGKFHLEMHLWNSGHFALWNNINLLEKSMQWYKNHLVDAKNLASSQGYKGARWPKMVAYDAVNSPSTIGSLLIWQQPHIILFLEWCYQAHHDNETLKKYHEMMFETAEFMADFAVYDKQNDRYVLGPPVIPAQERHNPRTTINPVFEIEYWRYGLKIACDWKKRLNENINEKWLDVINKMAMPTVVNGRYMAHENCPDTFENVATDHPSMLGAYGLIYSERIDTAIMQNTLQAVIDKWDYPSMWGWDFPLIAMTATRLGKPEIAIESLLIKSEKNTYVANGNNKQILRKDLPLYLPGNGGLLLAIAMMAAGYKGCSEDTPGFPKDGNWQVEFENINALL